MTDLKFKAGDHVMVPAKIAETDIREPTYLLRLENDWESWVSTAALASATLIERPLAVGDRVTWGTGERTYTISSIDGDLAIVRYLNDAWLTPLSELRRVEERG